MRFMNVQPTEKSCRSQVTSKLHALLLKA